MTQGDLEAELERAFQGFQATKLTDIMSGVHRGDSTTGRTFWDIVAKFSHPELEDMIAYLERNKGKMPYHELVNRHIEIVRYFSRLAHLQVPGTEELHEQELEALSFLYALLKNQSMVIA